MRIYLLEIQRKEFDPVGPIISSYKAPVGVTTKYYLDKGMAELEKAEVEKAAEKIGMSRYVQAFVYAVDVIEPNPQAQEASGE